MKTISLAEALRSGKDFLIRFPGKPAWHKSNTMAETWTTEAILHAQCKIVEDPKEVWIWKHNHETFSPIFYETKEDCEKITYGQIGRPVKFREVCDE